MLRYIWPLWVGLGMSLFPQTAFGQEEKVSKWEVNGYVKFLQLTTFSQGADFPLTNNFFHHRLNLGYFPSEKWTFALETRNRFFYGEQLKLNPNFGDGIDQPMGLVDLSVRWLDRKEGFLHSIIDRAYVNYAHDKWEVRLGRQRINWGLNMAWNPNDLFNALNFLDFDYEERPGNDALRIQYYTGIASSVEFAYSPSDSIEGHIGAILGKFNAGGYDFQTLAGLYQGDIALGGGWEGNIKGAGFKGEGTFFLPIKDLSSDSISSFSFSASTDYLFSNGIYGLLGVLYNSNGQRGGSLLDGNGVGGLQPSAKNLFPSIWSFIGSFSGNFSPLFTGNLSMIYANENHITALIPTLTYSIKENWDLDLIGQSFFFQNPLDQKFVHGSTTAYIRVRWSY